MWVGFTPKLIGQLAGSASLPLNRSLEVSQG